jgi:hypothetical protein
MARKTYIPTLLALLHRTCVYITRYNNIIIEFLPVGAAPLLEAVFIACQAFVEFVTHPPTE